MKTPILIIAPCQYTPNYNNCLMNALAERGERIIYATTVFPYGESPVPSGVKVWYCFFYLARLVGKITSSHLLRQVLRGIEYPLDILILTAYIILKRIKLVHYMWAPLPTIDLITIRILRWVDCRVIYTAHNPLPHEFKASYSKKHSRIYRNVDHLIVLSNFSRNEIIQFSNIPAEKVSVIVHGDFDYVLSQYPCNKFIVDKVRQAAAGRRIITFLGQIRPYKGLEYFIKALPLIKNRRPDTFFLIAGSTRFVNQHHIEQLLGRNCDRDSIYVDFRFLPTSDMKAYLSVTDVLVQPYLHASQSGNTVMAYSYGIPVVCTDVGGLAEMVEDGRTGYIIPPQNPQAIADAVVKCLEGDNLEKMRKYSRSFAAEKFNWQNIAAQTAQIYHQLYETTKKL